MGIYKFRDDIQSLRAIAVILVILYHIYPSLVPVGYIGVDIFFVISGYLISKKLFIQVKNNRLDIKQFYTSRIKRIIPALFTLIFSCLLFGYFTLLADEFIILNKHIISALGFYSNIQLLGESGYFDYQAKYKILLHLWSLGVEMQFYLILPIVFLILYKQQANFKIYGIVVIILFIISIIAYFSFKKEYPTLSFYLLITRMWEFLSGTFVSWLIVFYDQRKFEKYKNIVSIVSLTLIALITTNVIEKYYDFYLIIVVIATCLIIYSDSKSIIIKYLLRNRLLIFIGFLSYSLYLWHWPIISFYYIIGNHNSISFKTSIIIIIITIAFSFISYKYIESPNKFYQKYRNHQLLLMYGTFTLVILIINIYFIKNDGITLINSQYTKISSAYNQWDFPDNLIKINFKQLNYYQTSQNHKNDTIFVGDSNAEQYYPRIKYLLDKNTIHNNIIFATANGCLPISNIKFEPRLHHCENFITSTKEYISSNNSINTIIISALWNIYFTGSYFQKDYQINVNSKEYIEALSNLSSDIKYYKSLGKKIYLILNIPMGDELNPKYIAKRDLMNFPNIFKINQNGVNLNTLDSRYNIIKNDLILIANSNNINYINPMDHLCKNDICPPLTNDGYPIYKDTAHLHPTYVKMNAFFIDKIFND